MDLKDIDIAVSLTSRTIEGMLSDGLSVLSRNRMNRPNMLELLFAYPDPSELTNKNIDYIIKTLKNVKEPVPIIVTVRHKDEAPPDNPSASFRSTEEERARIFRSSVLSGADIIDIEYKHFLNIKIDDTSSKILLSMHDFKSTPSVHSLGKKYYEMHGFRRDALIKIATSSYGPIDNDNITNFIRAFSHKKNLVALAMRDEGRQTRVEGPLYGSLWTYACKEVSESSAPGQMTVGNLRSAMNIAAKYIKQ